MARSIILKKSERGEADELVVFFSREVGWLKGIAKNSRKSRVRFAGQLEQFSIVDLQLRPRQKDDMVWIEDAEVVNGFLRIRASLGKVALAAYFLELASILQAEAQPDPQLFDFLEGFLTALDCSELAPLQAMLAEIRLFAFLGYEPRFDLCPVCRKPPAPGDCALFSPLLGAACHHDCAAGVQMGVLLSPAAVAVVRRGLAIDADAASRLRLKSEGMEELREALSAFARRLRGGEINSLLFLESTGLWRGTGPAHTRPPAKRR